MNEPIPNWRKVANEIFRLARNYELRTKERSHTAFDLVIHPWTWREMQRDNDIAHHARWMPPQLFGYRVLQSNEVAEDEVRFVIKSDHKLLADPPVWERPST